MRLIRAKSGRVRRPVCYSLTNGDFRPVQFAGHHTAGLRYEGLRRGRGLREYGRLVDLLDHRTDTFEVLLSQRRPARQAESVLEQPR